eukprot:c6910_g1_i1 orf=2-193(-)
MFMGFEKALVFGLGFAKGKNPKGETYFLLFNWLVAPLFAQLINASVHINSPMMKGWKANHVSSN